MPLNAQHVLNNFLSHQQQQLFPLQQLLKEQMVRYFTRRDFVSFPMRLRTKSMANETDTIPVFAKKDAIVV